MEKYFEPEELRILIKHLRLTQEELTEAAGVCQGQVSRLIAGKFKKPGEAYKKLCIYVSRASAANANATLPDNAIILAAVAEVWDGSIEQANKLAKVIRSLGPLCTKGS